MQPSASVWPSTLKILMIRPCCSKWPRSGARLRKKWSWRTAGRPDRYPHAVFLNPRHRGARRVLDLQQARATRVRFKAKPPGPGGTSLGVRMSFTREALPGESWGVGWTSQAIQFGNRYPVPLPGHYLFELFYDPRSLPELDRCLGPREPPIYRNHLGPNSGPNQLLRDGTDFASIGCNRGP